MDKINYVDEFKKIFKDNIKRDGAKEVLDFLDTTDFYTSPASTRYHGNFEGGLVAHCVKVYNRFLKMVTDEFGADFVKQNAESLAIIALLHDVCKIGTYKKDKRNVKKDGVWHEVPYYSYEDSLPYGHGEKSVYMLSGFMRLTRDEAMAINWHMGAFDARAREGSTLSSAFVKFPLALLFHAADLLTSYRDEETIKD